MPLIEKTDTYATVEFADNYIGLNYMPYAPLRVHWSVLTAPEKEGYLRRSLGEMEQLPFVGSKRWIQQPLAFPRYRHSFNGMFPPGYPFYSMFSQDDEAEIPLTIKQAQVENALGIIKNEITSISDRQHATMQSLGAVKNVKYNKREAEMPSFGVGAEIPAAAKCPLSSETAYKNLIQQIKKARHRAFFVYPPFFVFR